MDTLRAKRIFLLASLILAVVNASLNCTVTNASIPQYACPNSTCPQIAEYAVGDIAWIWCAVDDMEQPNRWMFLENNRYAPAGPGVFERYQDCWFFNQTWPQGTELLPYCRNATFVPKPPPGPCSC
ncbi:hypothetical protein K491DRAFT_164670 [Lophiostoma macrostomum CBS 122681]|uniref:Secreted protein n=1 Tax=Lophiostoma macrostomum CBS 122681 TaxID=1314788 RepID=A0A6A6THZ2_9PLEO|nr:hypothetical protein K491DRAFT_164670 [Lophiostoma macrostomum CBS 122681]